MTFASLGEVFAELDAEVQAQARQVFVQLVRPGEGTEDTRRLVTSAEAREESWGLVQHLADKRLVVTGRDVAGLETVEVVHVGLPAGRSFMRKDKLTLDRPTTYQIRVPGELDESWSDWVAGMTIAVESEGEGEDPPVTILTGTVDQAALHGVLRRLYSLGLPLISVNPIES
jgi:hypothetical protein